MFVVVGIFTGLGNLAGLNDIRGPLDVFHTCSGDFLRWKVVLQCMHEKRRGERMQMPLEGLRPGCGRRRGEV